MKTCIKCEEEKEVSTEFFNKDKRCKDGFQGTCKVCRKVTSKQWREANPEKTKASSKAYYKENPDKAKAIRKAWYKANTDKAKDISKTWQQTNPEKYNIRSKAWAKANPDKIKAKSKAYHKANLEKVNAISKAYHKANPDKEKAYREANLDKIKAKQKAWKEANIDKVRQATQRRRARKLNLPSTLTLEQWETIVNHFNNRCAYCGEEKSLTQDHFHPLSKGGEYTSSNMICVCQPCNSSKGTKSFSIWYPQQSFYSKTREEFILSHLGYKNNIQQLALM
jgi:5-methylcytosine-specific restriction endonuclease McrA